MTYFPMVQEVEYRNPLIVFRAIVNERGAIFLDSAETSREYGRYSFIARDPFFILDCKKESVNPFTLLKKQLSQFVLRTHPHLPPFQGGVAGFFSYDLYRHLENIPSHRIDDMQFSDLLLGFYDVVMAFDHHKKRCWIFSSGFPEKNSRARDVRAKNRLEEFLRVTASEVKIPHGKGVVQEKDIQSNFTRLQYVASVEKVIQYILAGDIFEANISQRFKTQLPENLSSFDLYCRLREINPAPFAAFLNFSETIIASASPERFLQLKSGHIETRPIKGTRPRGSNPVEDDKWAHELLHSEKDHAENVMIVDLLRNDLSRVCHEHSVLVDALCALESFSTVHHLVSTIKGRLREEFSAVDLLHVAFPGGSITGAPKIRTMEIIAEIEPTLRGPYCGSVGYIGFNGDMDSSITIRTFAIKNNIVTFQAGGAVVMDSDPMAEYEETLTKANALKRALLYDSAH